MNSKLIAMATSSIMLMVSAATALETRPYKTAANQIVVPGLQPRQTYLVQTTDNQGRENTGYVRSNDCGYAFIGNGQNYQRITINNQTIRPLALSTQGYPNCNPQSKPNIQNR